MNTSRDARINGFINQISNKISTSDSIDLAADAAREELLSLGLIFTAETLELFDIAIRQVKEKKYISRDNSLIKQNEEWYEGPKTDDVHWPKLKDYLSGKKRWDTDTVTSIDVTSSEVVSLLANPKTKNFQKKGLVVGYVQSGKTANMTAVIAKAVDAGYNLIVILAGTTNKLRAQTQGRIENDIVDRNRHLWQCYTTSDDLGDYSIPANKAFTLPTDKNIQLVVMKKEKSRLESFRYTITGNDEIKPGTSSEALEKLKVLIIDDECDQASVNAADNSSADMTSINSEIRKILRVLPSVSYVGYTATPFANVFIDPYILNSDDDSDDLIDLYPQDFITALPRSRGYFGTREVFGFDPEDADKETKEEAGLNIIRAIPDHTISLLRPTNREDKDNFQPKLTQELESAILWFLISCAIRKYRKHTSNHMTMLIHTSQYKGQHKNMSEVVGKWIKDNKEKLINPESNIFSKMETLFKSEIENQPLFFSNDIKLNNILNHLEDVLNDLEVVIENSDSINRLNYDSEPKIYIVIGGAVLARGLTLEGLIVSFFLRTSKQYDTLLQMGRWFGYRNGYEDLPRLWTTKNTASKFRALSYIEEEIREDINKYRMENITPSEFAVRVRAIPGMAITSASKMKKAYLTDISYDGKHVQTIHYDHKNIKIIDANWSATDNLITKINGKWNGEGNYYLARNISIDIIEEFLNNYHICEQHVVLKKEFLLDYINGSRKDISKWNVGIVSPKSGKELKKEFSGMKNVNSVNRSQIIPNVDDFANIKALMSKSDITIDIDDKSIASNKNWDELKKYRPNVPLLLIYIIDADSKPGMINSKNRISLDAAGDLIGIGIVFPEHYKKPGKYYSVKLNVDLPDEDDEEVED